MNAETVGFFERMRDDAEKKRLKAMESLRKLAVEIEAGGDPGAGVAKVLDLAGLKLHDLEVAVQQIPTNREELAEAGRLEDEANTLTNQAQPLCDEFVKWQKVDAAIGLEMANLRQAEYQGDIDARARLENLVAEREAVRVKLAQAFGNSQELAERVDGIRSTADECRRSVQSVLGETPTVDVPERKAVPVPSLYRPDPAIESPPGMNQLESVRVLREQDVPLRQIAQIYELAEWQILAESDSPGIVVSNGTWRDPRWGAFEAKKRASEIKQRSADAVAAERNATIERQKPSVCPESPFDLWRDRVGVDQSAGMLRLPRAEVMRFFAEFDAEKEKQKKELQEASAAELENRLQERLAGIGG